MREPDDSGGWDWEEPEPEYRDSSPLPGSRGGEERGLGPRRQRRWLRDDLPPETRRRVALLAVAAALVALAIALAVVFGGDGGEPADVAAPPQPAPQPASAPPSPPEAPASAPAEPLFSEGTTLRPGDSGNAVRTLQRALRQLGFDLGTPDGNYGPRTEEAVRRFQESRDLVVDGIAGSATLAAVEEALAES